MRREFVCISQRRYAQTSETRDCARESRQGTCVAARLDIELEAVMNVRPSILCPIDYSDASAGALRYAAAIAEHFVTRLIVLTVEDPLLTDGDGSRDGRSLDPRGL